MKDWGMEIWGRARHLRGSLRDLHVRNEPALVSGGQESWKTWLRRESVKTAACQSLRRAGARKSRPRAETSLDQGSRAFSINLSRLVLGCIEAEFSSFCTD